MPANEQTQQTIDQAHRKTWWKVAFRVVAGGLILAALIWFSRDASQQITAMETWIKGQGILAPIIFIAAVAVLTSVFFPATLLAAVAGALFGLGWGTLIMFAGAAIGAMLDYVAARTLLRQRINRMLKGHLKLLAIQRAVKEEGLRLQFMLRMAPVNSAIFNYLLGASGVRFSPYLIATIGMLPGLFMEVYFGHVAKHISKTSANISPHSTMHLVITIIGFLVCVGIMICITRMAQRALAKAQQESSNPE